jgi:MoaA/NifB/PqqE/SkfB family radical SAM enzyme
MRNNGAHRSFYSEIFPLDEISVPYHVFTGSSCNFSCGFCMVQNSEPRQSVSSSQLISQIKTAVRSGAPSVIFVGGEPTMNRALPACVAIASEFLFGSVGVQTNGMRFLYPAYVGKLIDNGLSFVKFSLISHDESVFDKMVNMPGAHEKVAKGIANIASTGIDVSVTIPLVRSTFSHITKDIEYVFNKFNKVNNFELRAVGYNRENEPVPIQEMENALPGVMAMCRERGATISFGPFEGIPPCLFREPPPSLFRYPAAHYHPRTSFGKTPQCAECPFDILCNGIRAEYFKDGRPERLQTGVGQKLSATIARGSVIKTRRTEQDALHAGKFAADNAISISRRNTPNRESVISECIIRVNYRCNQNCLFCFVDTQCDDPPEKVIHETVESLMKGREKVRIVSFSGGEPTLNANLAGYVGILRKTGATEICLQTNAVLLSDYERVVALAESGLDSAFVSLHSHDEFISDLITGTEGSFRRTLKGLENLAGNGIFVYISHVINSFNYSALPDFVDFVSKELHGMPIVFSFASPHMYEMMFRGVIPRLSRIRDPLQKALQNCIDRKIPFSGLPSMCGIPLCILGPDIKFYPDIHPVNQAALQGVMHKNDGCRTCSMNDWCYGIRAFYVSMFGDEEMMPTHIDGFNPKLRDLESRMVFFKRFFD